MKRFLIILAIGILLMATGCQSKSGDKEDVTIYTTTTPEMTTTMITKEYVANIKSQKNIEIRTQMQGILNGIFVDEGQTVKAGQPLFRIAAVGVQEDIVRTKAAVDQARIDLENVSKLAAGNIVSPSAKKTAQAKLRASLADYRTAQLRKQLTTIYAPFAGIIGNLPVKKGSLLQEGDLISTLSDNNNMYVYFNVSEPEYLDYQVHSAQRSKLPLSLVLVNGDVFPTKGYVQSIAGEFDSQTGNIPFRAIFSNPQRILRNGQTGTIRIDIPKANALIIPQESTYELQDRRYVFVVDGNGVAHSRQIEVEDEQQGIYVISKGLSMKDHFLLDGVQKVKDGDHIKVKFKNPAEVMKSMQLNAN